MNLSINELYTQYNKILDEKYDFIHNKDLKNEILKDNEKFENDFLMINTEI